MRQCLIVFFFLLSAPVLAFDSNGSIEADFSFSGLVRVAKKEVKDFTYVSRAVNEQVWYLMGGLAAGSTEGVPRSDQNITRISFEEDPQNKENYIISYQYRGVGLFKDTVKDEVTFPLPINPFTIYKAATSGWGGNRCVTYREYSAEQYFFYFWNPKRAGCALKEGKDYYMVTARVSKRAKHPVSYPEYARLVRENGEVLIDVIVGPAKNGGDRDPNNNGDWGARNFRKIRREIMNLGGFRGTIWTEHQLRSFVPIPIPGRLPYVEEFFKDVSSSSRAKTIKIRLYFGSTDYKEDTEVFHYLLKESFERASVLAYMGHSGLGTSVGISDIEQQRKIVLQPSHRYYQIYNFHSCSSYFYYNEYFRIRKKSNRDPEGNRNLDVFSNGLTTFDKAPDGAIALISAIDRWATDGRATSYQEILQMVSNMDNLAVSLEEDNPLP